MSHLFSDPKFWLLISFIVFVILMIKPFKSMMIGGLDSKIEEIKQNIDKSLESFTEAEERLKDAEKRTLDLSNKVDEIISNAKSQAESISKNIIDKTRQTVNSKEKNSIDRIKQIELSAIQSIKSQASIELNTIIKNYFSNLSDVNRNKILDNSVIDLKSVNWSHKTSLYPDRKYLNQFGNNILSTPFILEQSHDYGIEKVREIENPLIVGVSYKIIF